MKKLSIITFLLIITVSSCTLAPEKTDKTNREEIPSKIVSEDIPTENISSGSEIAPQSTKNQTATSSEIHSITYSNPHYNIQFDYPSDFTLESHSGIAGWYESGKVDLDDYLSFSGSRGSFSIILPDHTAPFGTAPIHTRKDETITLGNRKVLKHIEFGSNDNPGPNAQGSWGLEYTIDIDGKKYKFQTWEYGTFSTYSIPDEVDTIIQDIIKSIK